MTEKRDKSNVDEKHELNTIIHQVLRTQADSNINIKPLKQFALLRLSKKPTLRGVLLSEPDKMTKSEFITKNEVWIRLFDLEK